MTYVYFVSYQFAKLGENATGFGNCACDTNKKITSIDQIIGLQKHLESLYNIDKCIIMNFQLLCEK